MLLGFVLLSVISGPAAPSGLASPPGSASPGPRRTVNAGLDTAWPWLTFAGLGMFHGLNPAMGWLFAVALGLHRHSRRAVLLAIPPMALATRSLSA